MYPISYRSSQRNDSRASSASDVIKEQGKVSADTDEMKVMVNKSRVGEDGTKCPSRREAVDARRLSDNSTGQPAEKKKLSNSSPSPQLDAAKQSANSRVGTDIAAGDHPTSAASFFPRGFFSAGASGTRQQPTSSGSQVSKVKHTTFTDCQEVGKEDNKIHTPLTKAATDHQSSSEAITSNLLITSGAGIRAACRRSSASKSISNLISSSRRLIAGGSSHDTSGYESSPTTPPRSTLPQFEVTTVAMGDGILNIETLSNTEGQQRNSSQMQQSSRTAAGTDITSHSDLVDFHDAPSDNEAHDYASPAVDGVTSCDSGTNDESDKMIATRGELCAHKLT